jgi:hypothetical protein
MTITRALFFCLLLGIVATSALAGSRPSLQHEEAHYSSQQIMQFAKQVEREMAQRGARVAIVGRVGMEPEQLPPGIRFTHVGFAVYSRITTKDGTNIPGYAMYNLYQDPKKPSQSSLEQDYPPDFFSPSVQLKAGIIIPNTALQRRLLSLITQPNVTAALHNPHYSVISNPWDDRFQNCTEYVLRLTMAAIYNTTDPQQIQSNIRHYFTPQPLALSKVELWLGSLLAADVFLQDQGERAQTTTFTSLANFMQQHQLADAVFTVEQP